MASYHSMCRRPGRPPDVAKRAATAPPVGQRRKIGSKTTARAAGETCLAPWDPGTGLASATPATQASPWGQTNLGSETKIASDGTEDVVEENGETIHSNLI
eukprot:Rmarinus@m.26220